MPDPRAPGISRTHGEVLMHSKHLRIATMLGAIAIAELIVVPKAEAYTWTQLTGSSPLCGSTMCSAIPTNVWTPTPTLPSTVPAAVTLAPSYFGGNWYVYLLTTTTSGSDHEIVRYEMGAANTVKTTWGSGSANFYTYGVNQDADNEAPWGVNDSNELMECESGDNCWTTPATATPWSHSTSV